MIGCQFEEIGKRGRKACEFIGNIEVLDIRDQKHWNVCYLHYLHLGTAFDMAKKYSPYDWQQIIRSVRK